MTHTTYPNHLDLQEFLVAGGFISNPPASPESLLDYTGALASTRADWERRTGWRPFLKDAADVTRSYDPPGHPHRGAAWIGTRGGMRTLDLGAGLLSLTTLTIGVSSTTTGTALTDGTDFVKRPTNATAEGRPFEFIEFFASQWGTAESITVAGRWGYAVNVPEDVFRAFLLMSTVYLMPQVLAISGPGVGIKEMKLGDNSFTFGGRMEEVNMMQKQYEACLNRYRRVRV